MYAAPVCAERDAALDVIRGFAICMMIATHVSFNSRGAWLLHLPLPISSAADWFVILSGVAVGIRGTRRPDLTLLRRALLIYGIHCAFTVSVLAAHEVTGTLQAPASNRLVVRCGPRGWSSRCRRRRCRT